MTNRPANRIAPKPTQPVQPEKVFQTALVKTQTAYTEMVVKLGSELNIEYDDEQKICVMNLVGKMKELLDKEGLDIQQINQTNVTGILQTAAMLKLNASASPRECYLILRNEKNAAGQWTKKFEFGIEGDGNDKILREYGVDIKRVYPYWAVREDDEFSYPSYKGLEVDPPAWTPKSMTGKIVRVVYPIKYTDGSVQYHISEREEVKSNLLAHIGNNLLKNKNYTEDQKQKILDKLEPMSLDEIFNDEEAKKIMSPAWRNASSREAMLLRKMRNNAIKRVPKDFSNAFVSKAYESTFEDYPQQDDRIDVEGAVDIDVEEPETVIVPEPQTESQPAEQPAKVERPSLL